MPCSVLRTMADLSYPQYVVSVLLLILSSLISLTGSAIIIKCVCGDLTKVHHRTLLLLSLGDIVLSINNFIHPFMLPEGMPGGRPWASGNTQTCTAAGFMFTTSIGWTFSMSAFLSINFLFQVRYKWSEAKIKRCLAPSAYAFGAFASLGTCVPGLFTESYNPTYLIGFCFLREWPNNCHEPDSGVECIRGGAYTKIQGQIGSLIIFLISCTGFVATFLLYRSVKTTIAASNRHNFATRASTTRSSEVTTSMRDQPSQQGGDNNRFNPRVSIIDERQQERLRIVNWQCVLYTAAYFNTLFWNALFQVIANSMGNLEGRIGEPLLYSMLLVTYAFFPIQGLFNAMIFLTPTYRKWRKALGHESSWWLVLRKAISNQPVPTRAQVLQQRADEQFALAQAQHERTNEFKKPEHSSHDTNTNSYPHQSLIAAELTRVASRLLPSRMLMDTTTIGNNATGTTTNQASMTTTTTTTTTSSCSSSVMVAPSSKVFFVTDGEDATQRSATERSSTERSSANDLSSTVVDKEEEPWRRIQQHQSTSAPLSSDSLFRSPPVTVVEEADEEEEKEEESIGEEEKVEESVKIIP